MSIPVGLDTGEKNIRPTRPAVPFLALIDRLIISLDSTDPQALGMVSVPDAYAETVIANAREAASLQKAYNFKLILNAVITPETLPGMDMLLAFCAENNAQISFSPQSVNNLPRYRRSIVLLLKKLFNSRSKARRSWGVFLISRR